MSLDLQLASRDELIAHIQLLENLVKQLQADLDSLRGGGQKPDPPSFVKLNRPARSKKKKRKKRSHGFARKLDFATARVEHGIEQCPDCHVALKGHGVVKSRRVIELPAVEVRVVEHNLVERHCPKCRKRFRPDFDLSRLAVGKHRLGISIQAEVALLREACRLPYGYAWSFSTDKVRYFLYRKSRSAEVVKEVPGERFDGVVVSDFYAAYNAHLRLDQRCWVHLLRDIHELKGKHAKDQGLRKWEAKVKAIYERAKAYKGPSKKLAEVERQTERVRRQREFEQELMRVCRPHIKKKRVQSRLCERVERNLPEMFMFVGDERVPSDNNEAERSVREVVVSRKISGGTRSEKGSEAKSILASLFGTWRLQGLDFY